MCSDWSTIASYLAIIISLEVIIAGALDYKMAWVLRARFVNVKQRVINAIEEDTNLKSTKDNNKFGVTLFKRKICSFDWLNWINLLNSSENWLLISIRVLKTILTEWFHKQNEFTTVKTIIRLRFECVSGVIQQYSLSLRPITIK